MINQTLWLSFKSGTRDQLRKEFNIPRSSFIWVKGIELAQDGTTDKDLEVITNEQAFIERAKEIELGEPVVVKVEEPKEEIIIKTLNTNAKPIQKSKRKAKQKR